MPKITKSEEILVSVCFPDFVTSAENDELLDNFVKKIDEVYRYWEIILVVDAAAVNNFEHILKKIPNVRLLKVRNKLPYYRKRTVGASEAIGDVVVLASVSETPYLNILDMIESANKNGSIVVGEKKIISIFNPILKILGFISGFHVAANYLSTIAYPRTLINQLLKHSNKQIALRFIPRDSRIQILKEVSTTHIKHRAIIQDWVRRFGFIQKLFANSASTILAFVAFLSVIVSITAPLYGLYAIITWFSLDTVQPGWLTTSLVLSFTVTFLGVALLGISLGIQSIIDILSPDVMDDIIGEVSTVDLFGEVSSDLNVEVVTSSVNKKEK